MLLYKYNKRAQQPVFADSVNDAFPSPVAQRSNGHELNTRVDGEAHASLHWLVSSLGREFLILYLNYVGIPFFVRFATKLDLAIPRWMCSKCSQ